MSNTGARKRERQFELSSDLMVRGSLLQLAEEDHVLLLTMHHIAADGWSLTVLWDELKVSYDAYGRGEKPDLPDLPVQYVDYTFWQRQRLRGQRLEKLLQYWRHQLANVSSLELPTDRARPSSATCSGAKHRIELNEDLVDGLKSLCQREGVTLQMALLATFQTLLWRYTGREDIAVATPIAGRTHTLLERQIGFFVNTLVLRTDFSGDPDFRELLRRVQQVALGAYDHQDLPFDIIVQELQPDRDPRTPPFAQALFQLMSFAETNLTLAQLDVAELPPQVNRTRFDLELHLRQQSNSIQGFVTYSTELFDASTIARMVEHLQILLNEVVRNPGQQLNELPLLSDAEREQLLQWNSTSVSYPRDRCVHELFEEQVERTPDGVALVFQNRSLTYRELDQRANRLAHRLVSHGVGPETLVGLCLPPSLDQVIGMLGILKAGGAYLPLDIEEPRMEFMLRDAQAETLLTHRDLADRLPALPCTTIVVDEEPASSEEHSSRLNSAVRADSLAYVIYTSGSTGRPKGVEVVHRGIVRLVVGANYARMDSSLCVLQLAPVSFDASTFEIWAPLLNGGRCVLFPDRVPDVRDLEKVIQTQGINTLWLTASLFNALIDERPQALSGLRQLLTGGEALSVSHVRKALELLPQTQLVNGYGPTEGTTFTCCFSIASLAEDARSVPIGRPIANTHVYVLDASGSPAPIGASGELFIGGDGLARGYRDRSELTDEKFVANPFANDPQSKLYRTGDSVRWRPDGNLEFLGRLDDQIKLRGFRIEPAEIEAVLNQHPEISQSAVVLHPGGDEKRLMAYVVSNATDGILGVTEHLRRQLPHYMVPSSMVRLNELPRTSSGKVNRRLLAKTDGVAISLDCERRFVAPQNITEERVAAVWRRLLGLRQVGVHDNFFDLGGHSLLVVAMVEELNRELGRNLTVGIVYRTPTVTAIAAHLSRDEDAEDTEEPTLTDGSFLSVLKEGSGTGTIVCVGLGTTQLVRRTAAEVQVLHLGLDGINSQPYRSLTIPQLATAYAQEIVKAATSQPLTMVGYSYGGLLTFALAHCLPSYGLTDFHLVLIEPSTKWSFDTAKPRSPKKAREISFVSRLSRATYGPMAVTLIRCWTCLMLALRQPVPIGRRWSYYEAAIVRNIRSFDPLPLHCEHVHLVGGRSFLEANATLWSKRLVNPSPTIHDLGDTCHGNLVNEGLYAQRWVSLVQQLCGERA